MSSKATGIIELNGVRPFSQGGNRLCFVHPHDPERCLKVHQEHRTPSMRRAKKHLLARIRPLAYYDENLTETEALDWMHARYTKKICSHLPKSFGITQTDLGPAHEMELIRDRDGLISPTLEQQIWKYGMSHQVRAAIEAMRENWESNVALSRNLLPHNLLLQDRGDHLLLRLIDGFGRVPKFQFMRNPSYLGREAFNKLEQRIETILQRKERGEPAKPRIHLLDHQNQAGH